MLDDEEIDQIIRDFLKHMEGFVGSTSMSGEILDENVPKPFNINDVKLLKDLTWNTIKTGCKECGFNIMNESIHFICQPGISLEQDQLPPHIQHKVFFLNIECPSCKAEYKDIMAVRPLDD